MSDIQPGDVVVCVDASPRAAWVEYFGSPDYCRLANGRYYRVLVVLPADPYDAYHEEGIDVGVPAPDGNTVWGALRFRKIRPADPEFVALLAQLREPAL